MNRKMKFLLSYLLTLTFLTSVPHLVRANEVIQSDFSNISPLSESGSFELLRFRVNQVSLFQVSEHWNSSLSWEVSWNPKYQLSRNFGLVANIGNTFFLNMDQSKFPVLETQMLAAYTLGSFVFEIGGGREFWINKHATHAWMTTSNVHYQFKQKLLGAVDSLFLGYSTLFQIPLAHQFKIGTQISL